MAKTNIGNVGYMFRSRILLGALVLLLVHGLATSASADCKVGKRVFPGMLSVDDPCVDDELTFPIIASFPNSDASSTEEVGISGEFDKTITKNFAVDIAEDWIHLHVPNLGSSAGFDNFVTSFKYQLVSDAQEELAMSAALVVDWGGTGSRALGEAPFTTLTPTWYAGKGFGFLPQSMKFLKPIGVTVQVGYSFPTASSTATFDENSGLLTTTPNPQFLVWGGSLQYSMPYLKSMVVNCGFPDLINYLTPIVEFNLETQTADFDSKEKTTGTMNPGLIYNNKKYQLSVEAIIPVNRASGDGVGVIAALHLHLDDLLPDSLGKPLFGSAAKGTDD
jgi:hypothetical protein